jgi:hypothetical protein
MKRILAFLYDLARVGTGRSAPAFHNDSLRANQFVDPRQTFSYWRALVS